MAAVVFSDVATEDAGLQGTLFKGLKFWLAQRVPQRSRFIADIKANGGDVLPLDKQADIRIVDHARKEVLPGTHSYTFVEHSIRNGRLEDLKDHVAGPQIGTVRSVGSTTQPAKATRNKFTEEDDRILCEWVQNTPQKFGGTDGNEIYKQLEAQNPRHPWQSWRDRWVKQLRGKPRIAFVPDNAPPTPPSDHPPPQNDIEMSRTGDERKPSFSEDDRSALLNHGENIMNIEPEDRAVAWELWATKYDKGEHSAQQWENLWEHSIRPIYLRTRLNGTQHETTDSPRKDPQAAIPLKSKEVNTTEKSSTIGSYHSPSRIPRYVGRESNVDRRSPLSLVQTQRRDHPKTDIPRSDPPEMPQGDNDQHENNQAVLFMHIRDEPTSSPAQSKLDELLEKKESPKRKRDVFDEDALPSSSPPGSPWAVPLSLKRQRVDEVRCQPLEIASTPENSPTRQNLDLASRVLAEDATDILDISHNGLSENGSDNELESIPLRRQTSPTLSSPTRFVPYTQNADTQAAFQDPTQFIDFEVPAPEEGWQDDASQSDIGIEPDPSTQLVDFDQNQTIPETQPSLPDTQALLNSRTQMPDFDVPEPEGGWDAIDQVLSSSPPPMLDRRSISPPLVAINSLRPEERGSDPIGDFVKSQEAIGHHIEDIVTALRATSTDLDKAEFVLLYMKRKGRGCIPENEPGIWTQDDDADLHAQDARGWIRLQDKHGNKCCDERWEYLEHYRD